MDINMKQIIITITILAIAIALVIGVVVPIFKHSSDTGNDAVLKAQATITRIGGVLR